MRLLLLILLTAVLHAADPVTVGVMPFANNSLADKQGMEPLSKGLAEMMNTELSKMSGLKVIERTDLEKIMKEIGLSMTGMVDEGSVQQAGKLLGADMLLLGSFNHGFDGQVRIDARLVKVETGETVKAEEATGKKKKIFKLVKKLSFKFAEQLDLKLSKAEKKAVNASDNTDYDAFLLFSKGLDAEDRGDFAEAKKLYEKALKKNKKYTRARNRLELLVKAGK